MSLNDIELKGQTAEENGRSFKKLKVKEFLDTFEDYFRDRGFVIKKKEDSVRAAYETLHFKAFTDDSDNIFIMKGKEQIASISVNDKSLRESIKHESSLFYYFEKDLVHPFDSPLSVLNSIFNA